MPPVGGLYDDPFLRLPNQVSSYQVVPVSQVDINPNDILDDGDDGFMEVEGGHKRRSRRTVLGLPVGGSNDGGGSGTSSGTSSGKSNNTSHSTLAIGKQPCIDVGSTSGSTLAVPNTAASAPSKQKATTHPYGASATGPHAGNSFSMTSVNGNGENHVDEAAGGASDKAGGIDTRSTPSFSPMYDTIMTERSAWLDKDKHSRRKMRCVLYSILAFLVVGAVAGGVIGGIFAHRNHHKSSDS
ncbi:hypothetical protein KEM52_000808 [Ascosphaera acerosa]|nr:hypothetical protein KEM52_000808 [Ascosphaera acerosa]